jgi:hypothetical protein
LNQKVGTEVITAHTVQELSRGKIPQMGEMWGTAVCAKIIKIARGLMTVMRKLSSRKLCVLKEATFT